MSEWIVISSKTFIEVIKKHKNNRKLLFELDKKIERLREEPNSIGGFLSGKLHGYKSTRLSSKFRLIFRLNNKEKKVYLIALDHRKFDYSRF